MIWGQNDPTGTQCCTMYPLRHLANDKIIFVPCRWGDMRAKMSQKHLIPTPTVTYLYNTETALGSF